MRACYRKSTGVKSLGPPGEMLAFFSQPVFWRIAGAYVVAFDRKCTFGVKNDAQASYNFFKRAAPLGEMLAFFPQPVFGPPKRACRGTPSHVLGPLRISWGPFAFLEDPRTARGHLAQAAGLCSAFARPPPQAPRSAGHLSMLNVLNIMYSDARAAARRQRQLIHLVHFSDGGSPPLISVNSCQFYV